MEHRAPLPLSHLREGAAGGLPFLRGFLCESQGAGVLSRWWWRTPHSHLCALLFGPQR